MGISQPKTTMNRAIVTNTLQKPVTFPTALGRSPMESGALRVINRLIAGHNKNECLAGEPYEANALRGPRARCARFYPLPAGRTRGVEHPDHAPVESDRGSRLPGIPGRHRQARPAVGPHSAIG